MIKRILNLILILLTTNLLMGQGLLTGTVIDKSDSVGIPFAKIIVKINGIELDTLTDFDGNFRIQNLDFDSVFIKAAFVGYHEFDTILDWNLERTDFKIGLKPNTELGETISIPLNAEQNAIKSIDEGEIFIFLPGGLLGSPALPTDSIFEKKYNIKFLSHGCGGHESAFYYNKTIFKYLDEKYGYNWRIEIRQDAVGLKN